VSSNSFDSPVAATRWRCFDTKPTDQCRGSPTSRGPGGVGTTAPPPASQARLRPAGDLCCAGTLSPSPSAGPIRTAVLVDGPCRREPPRRPVSRKRLRRCRSAGRFRGVASPSEEYLLVLGIFQASPGNESAQIPVVHRDSKRTTDYPLGLSARAARSARLILLHTEQRRLPRFEPPGRLEDTSSH
jgi:hypothetical protein